MKVMTYTGLQMGFVTMNNTLIRSAKDLRILVDMLTAHYLSEMV